MLGDTVGLGEEERPGVLKVVVGVGSDGGVSMMVVTEEGGENPRELRVFGPTKEEGEAPRGGRDVVVVVVVVAVVVVVDVVTVVPVIPVIPVIPVVPVVPVVAFVFVFGSEDPPIFKNPAARDRVDPSEEGEGGPAIKGSPSTSDESESESESEPLSELPSSSPECLFRPRT
jgi:hypothetical protein